MEPFILDNRGPLWVAGLPIWMFGALELVVLSFLGYVFFAFPDRPLWLMILDILHIFHLSIWFGAMIIGFFVVGGISFETAVLALYSFAGILDIIALSSRLVILFTSGVPAGFEGVFDLGIVIAFAFVTIDVLQFVLLYFYINGKQRLTNIAYRKLRFKFKSDQLYNRVQLQPLWLFRARASLDAIYILKLALSILMLSLVVTNLLGSDILTWIGAFHVFNLVVILNVKAVAGWPDKLPFQGVFYPPWIMVSFFISIIGLAADVTGTLWRLFILMTDGSLSGTSEILNWIALAIGVLLSLFDAIEVLAMAVAAISLKRHLLILPPRVRVARAIGESFPRKVARQTHRRRVDEPAAAAADREQQQQAPIKTGIVALPNDFTRQEEPTPIVSSSGGGGGGGPDANSDSHEAADGNREAVVTDEEWAVDDDDDEEDDNAAVGGQTFSPEL